MDSPPIPKKTSASNPTDQTINQQSKTVNTSSLNSVKQAVPPTNRTPTTTRTSNPTTPRNPQIPYEKLTPSSSERLETSPPTYPTPPSNKAPKSLFPKVNA